MSDLEDEFEDIFGEGVVYEQPKKGAILFQETSNYYHFAHFGWGIKSRFYGYIKGYKEVSDMAIEKAVTSQDIVLLDTYVFPIIFNYRQFLELSLKSLYLDYSDDAPQLRIQTIEKVSHDLMKIWRKVEPISLSPYKDKDHHREMVKVVESYLLQYHEMDEKSFNFRYPITKQLTPVFSKEMRVDLVNLRNRMQELSNFFDGMDGALDDMKRSKEEWEAEYRRIEDDIRSEIEAEMRAEWRSEMAAEARANRDWE
ncbi:hypothetical protein D3C81_669110 [compost metagenome]